MSNEILNPAETGLDRLLIHIGFHKTGTSYLQKLIFNDTAGGFRTPVNRHLLRDMFVQTDPFTFDAAVARGLFLPQLEQTVAEHLVPVLTHEQFSGQPAGNGYGLRRREREVSRKEVADRLHASFPEARVLIVIREQRAMIRSIYKWLVCGWEGRLSARIDQFLDQSPLDRGFSPLFHFGYLEYHWVVWYYRHLFGESSVLTLPYEWLGADPAAFVNRIRQFMYLPPTEEVPRAYVNAGKSAATCQVKRWLNRILVSPNRPGTISGSEQWAASFVKKLNRHLPAAIHSASEKALSQQIERLVAGVYAESNEKTSIMTGIDLAALGYEMPSKNPAPLSD